jgi:hypothetical protein
MLAYMVPLNPAPCAWWDAGRARPGYEHADWLPRAPETTRLNTALNPNSRPMIDDDGSSCPSRWRSPLPGGHNSPPSLDPAREPCRSELWETDRLDRRGELRRQPDPPEAERKPEVVKSSRDEIVPAPDALEAALVEIGMVARQHFGRGFGRRRGDVPRAVDGHLAGEDARGLRRWDRPPRKSEGDAMHAAGAIMTGRRTFAAASAAACGARRAARRPSRFAQGGASAPAGSYPVKVIWP